MTGPQHFPVGLFSKHLLFFIAPVNLTTSFKSFLPLETMMAIGFWNVLWLEKPLLWLVGTFTYLA